MRYSAVLFEHRDHGCEGGPIDGAAGLAELRELLDQGPAFVDGESPAGVKLRVDRVAALGLLPGRDANVDDRLAHRAVLVLAFFRVCRKAR